MLRKLQIRAPSNPERFQIHSRKELEEKYGKDWERTAAKKMSSTPFWVTDIPREFYDY